MTPEQKKYLIGKQYEAEKQAVGGDRKSKYQNDTLNANTGERIAKQNNISRISVIRAEGYAKAVDLADEAVPGIKKEILSGAVNATDAEVVKIAKAAPEERPALVEKLKAPKETKPYTYKNSYYRPKPDKSLSQMQQISEDMLTARGTGTAADMLYELEDAADSLMFRWNLQQETRGNLFQNEMCIAGTRKLIAELTEYLQSVESRLNEYTG